MRRLIVAFSVAAVLLGAVFAGTVSAKSFAGVIVLPGAHSAEGIARGAGSTFYAGEAFTGDIFRGDLRTGSVSKFIVAPAGRMALGLRADVPHHLLFVAGGFTGQGYVYNLRTGAPVASYEFGQPNVSIINDVIVAGGAAWFTDSALAKLYRVPIGRHGSLGAASTLSVSGPAAATPGMFNMNGIAATPNGKTLIVAHSALGTLFTVNPKTGVSAPIAGANVPNVDGILFEAGRLWAVQNADNQVTELRLRHHLSSATVERVYTKAEHPAFGFPTTIARFGGRLAVVNAHFDTGFPPTASTYEVVVFKRH